MLFIVEYNPFTFIIIAYCGRNLDLVMNKNWGRWFYFAAITISGNNVLAQEAEDKQLDTFNPVPAYSQIFKENIGIAVEEHPRTAAALAMRDEQRYMQDEARSALYPQIGVDLTGRHRIADNFEDRFDNITQRSLRDTAANVSLVGRQLLFDGGNTSSKISSARHAFTAAHEEYSYEASAIALEAVETHYYVLYQRLRREYHQENVARHREILDMVQQRFESGRGPNRDVTLMQSRLAIAETSASKAQMDLEGSVSRYEEVYSFAPENLKRPEMTLGLPANELEALETGFQNNPLLVMASSKSFSSREDMNAVKAERLPNVSVELAATKYDLERGTPDYDVTGRLVLNYDLYNGGARSARISRFMKNYQRTRHNEDKVNREVNRIIKVAFQNMESQHRQVLSLEKARDASRVNRDQTREQFEVTGGSLFNLLEAEKEHHSAKEQYLGGLVEHELSRFRLLDAMGTLLPTMNIILRRDSE